MLSSLQRRGEAERGTPIVCSYRRRFWSPYRSPSLFLPAERRSRDADRVCFPARRDGGGDGRRRPLARGRTTTKGRERRASRRRAHQPVSPYENDNNGTVEKEKGATPSPPHKRSIISKESSKPWTGEGICAVSRLLQRWESLVIGGA